MRFCPNGMDIFAFAEILSGSYTVTAPPLSLQPTTAIEKSVAQTAADERCSHCPLPIDKEVLVGCLKTVPALCLTGD